MGQKNISPANASSSLQRATALSSDLTGNKLTSNKVTGNKVTGNKVTGNNITGKKFSLVTKSPDTNYNALKI